MKMISVRTLFVVLLLATFCCYGQTNAIAIIPIGSTTPETIALNYSDETLANHATFFKGLTTTGLDKVLEKLGPYTIFAPSDAAFEKLSPLSIEELFQTENREQLKSLLNYHIVTGTLTASDILSKLCQTKGKVAYATIHGEKIEAKIEGLNIVLIDNQGNKATIISADLNRGDDGTFHGIDNVILPSSI